MKQEYMTPSIEADELVREDILLASGEYTRNGIHNIEDTARDWTLEEIL